MEERTIGPILGERQVSRREFLKFCTIMAGTLALESTFGPRIARALASPERTPVIWLEFQDCAGCSESFLRASRPTAAEVVLDVLSVDYHETIMAASGHLAEEAKAATIDAGGYLLVVEGSMVMKCSTALSSLRMLATFFCWSAVEAMTTLDSELRTM